VADESPTGDFQALPSRHAPVVGADGAGRLLAVWLRDDFDHQRLVARRFDRFGSPARAWQDSPLPEGLDGGGASDDADGGTQVLVDETLVLAEGLPTPSNASPSVAGLSGGGWVVAWARPALGGADIAYRLVAPDGTLGLVRAVAQATDDLQSGPWVVPLGDGFFIGWVTAADTAADPDGGIRGRRFGADGLPASAEMALATTRAGVQSELALASTGDAVLAVWKHASGATSSLRARRFGASGALDTSDLELRAGASSPALSVLADGDVALAFVTTEEDVHVGRIPAGGAPTLLDVEPVADEPDFEESRPTVAGGPGGGVVVTWESGFPLDQLAAPALGAAPGASEWAYIEAVLSGLALSRGSVSRSPRGVWFAFEGVGEVRGSGALSLYLLTF
jgi:hypothetical protein